GASCVKEGVTNAILRPGRQRIVRMFFDQAAVFRNGLIVILILEERIAKIVASLLRPWAVRVLFKERSKSVHGLIGIARIAEGLCELVQRVVTGLINDLPIPLNGLAIAIQGIVNAGEPQQGVTPI